jgi:hypothetical protein
MKDLIGEKTIIDIRDRTERLLRMYLSTINQVYESEDEIKISMPVKIKLTKGGANAVSVGISFVTDKIDDTSSGFIEEKQLSLPLDSTDYTMKCPLLPAGDEIFSKKCSGCTLRHRAMMINGVDAPFAITVIPPRIPETAMIQYISCSSWSDYDTRESVKEHLKAYNERTKAERLAAEAEEKRATEGVKYTVQKGGKKRGE